MSKSQNPIDNGHVHYDMAVDAIDCAADEQLSMAETAAVGQAYTTLALVDAVRALIGAVHDLSADLNRRP
jgi:hypothetical protein